jgi:glyoxalase-like protein
VLTGIDHVLIAFANPDAAAGDLESAVGLRASAGGRHEAHGTFNRLVWLGDSFIELMGVFDPALAATSWWGKQALAVLERGGGYMGLVLASDDIEVDVAAVRARGSALGTPESGSRTRPDGRIVRWRSARLPAADADMGVFFLIEHDLAGAEWTPAERDQRATQAHPLGGPVRLERVELPVASTHRATMRVHRDMGVAFRPSLAGRGARDGAVGRQTLRLFPAALKDPPRVVVRGGTLGREIDVLGCKWLVEPAA